MAVANNRIRVFKTPAELEYFLINDSTITSVVTIITDDNGYIVLLYDIT